MRIWLRLGLGVAAIVALCAAPASAQSGRPVRKGTILGGYTIALGPANCGIVPDCAAWLASGCDPRLAGQEPAAFTSIVDVSDIAGSDRRLDRNPSWLANAVEFWTTGCHALRSPASARSSLRIPSAARWLTITGSAVPNSHWELW